MEFCYFTAFAKKTSRITHGPDARIVGTSTPRTPPRPSTRLGRIGISKKPGFRRLLALGLGHGECRHTQVRASERYERELQLLG